MNNGDIVLMITCLYSQEHFNVMVEVREGERERKGDWDFGWAGIGIS